MSEPLSYTKFQAFDSNGDPLVGGLVFTYEPGTTTKKATYSDYALSSANTNPIVLDSRGEALVFLDGTTKIVLSPATDTDPPTAAIWTMDNVITSTIPNFAYFLSDYSTLALALSGIGATVTTLYIDEDVTLAANTTWPSTLALKTLNGATITLGAYNLDLTSCPHTELTPGCFNVNSTGDVTGLQKTIPEYFGALANGSHDDTAEIQAAIDAVVSGGVVEFSSGNYITSSSLLIDSPITLQGSQKNYSVILCLDNNGITIDKISNVNIYNLEIAHAVRHTTTANAHTGILVSGLTGTRPTNHCYRDVYVDGFRYGIYADWIWSSVFDNVRTAYGQTGLTARYLSVNNNVINCSFSGNAAGYGINLDGLVGGLEGWMISNSLFYNNRRGINATGATHVYVSNCILDDCGESGISIDDDGTNFGGNWSITNNYIAMTDVATITGIAGIHIANTISNTQNRGCQISNNHILAYSGMTFPYGIYAENANGINNAVTGNTISGFATSDIRLVAAGNAVTGNTCLSSVTNNIHGLGMIANNIGTVYYYRAVNYSMIGKMKMTYDEAIPTTGTWARGDICWSTVPASAGVVGWVCSVAGTPGTWIPFAMQIN